MVLLGKITNKILQCKSKIDIENVQKELKFIARKSSIWEKKTQNSLEKLEYFIKQELMAEKNIDENREKEKLESSGFFAKNNLLSKSFEMKGSTKFYLE